MAKGPAPLIHLASQSPRRKALLEALGFRVAPVPPGPEEAPEGLPPKDLALALALAKGQGAKGEWLLAADTVVDLEGEALGKPKDPMENQIFLERLQGRDHWVHTAFYLRTPLGEEILEVHSARVHFRPLSQEEILWYVRSGEGLDKAGGYGAQGLGMALIERVEGDFYTVVGLPVARVFALLWARGVRP